MANLVLTQCRGPLVKDKIGYDMFDAFTVRDILYPDIFGIDELCDEEIEYLRLKLLRYKEQIQKIGLAHGYNNEQIEKALQKLDDPICEGSIFIRGKADGTPYGRISYKWVKDNIPKFTSSEGRI